MEFIRENILKILSVMVIFVVLIILFVFIFSNKGVKKSNNYSSMEQKLVSATIKYLDDNPKLNPSNEGEMKKVNLDTLVNSKYIDQLYSIEDSNVECSGYVQIINENSKNRYVPYIKCGNYYETTSIADYIINNTTLATTDDGLYKIDNGYIYRGENPYNYLMLGQKLYRIIEINEEKQLRLISTQKYQNSIVWDDRYNVDKNNNYGINDYSKSRLKDSLKDIYNDDEFFSKQEKEKIINHSVCVGKRSTNDKDIYSSSECSSEYPNQYVSIIRLSDYAKASIDQNCKSVVDRACSNYNYMETI